MSCARCVRICLIAIALTLCTSFAGVFISVNFAPPVLPVYAQPVCPGDAYMWIPGYWAYGPGGYYWVPGTWVLAPSPGLLWTPGYWGWGGGVYLWHPGYWGPHVGFYGGVNYGFGYTGVGYVGGGWYGHVFRYNTAVTNVNVTVVHNTYIDRTVVYNGAGTRTSYNGPGGITARPNATELAASHEQHMAPTSTQMSHERFAGTNRANFATVNHGAPATAAVARPMTTSYPGNTAGGNTVHTRSFKPTAPTYRTSAGGGSTGHYQSGTGSSTPHYQSGSATPHYQGGSGTSHTQFQSAAPTMARKAGGGPPPSRASGSGGPPAKGEGHERR